MPPKTRSGKKRGLTDEDSSEVQISEQNSSSSFKWETAIVIAFWILKKQNSYLQLFSPNQIWKTITTTPIPVATNNNRPTNHIAHVMRQNINMSRPGKIRPIQALFLRDDSCSGRRKVAQYGMETATIDEYLSKENISPTYLQQLFSRVNKPKDGISSEEALDNIFNTSPSASLSEAIMSVYSSNRTVQSNHESAHIRDLNKEETSLNRILHNLSLFLSKYDGIAKGEYESMMQLAFYAQQELERFHKFRFSLEDIMVVFLGRTGVGKSFIINLMLKNCYPCNYSEYLTKASILETKILDHPLVEYVASVLKIKATMDIFTNAHSFPLCEQFYNSTETINQMKDLDEKFDILLSRFASQGCLEKSEKDQLALGYFLLPSTAQDNSTTSFPFIIRGGAIPAIRIDYFSQEEYSSIKGAPKAEIFPSNSDYFFARGKDMLLDRLFIKFIIKNFFENKSICYVIKEVILYLPVNFLMNNNLNIVDAPGSNDNLPIQKYQRERILNQATHINVIIDRTLNQSIDVTDELQKCNFIGKILSNKMKYSMAVISVRESTNPVNYKNLSKEVATMQNSIEINQEAVKKLLELTWASTTSEHIKKLRVNGVDIDAFKGNIQYYHCYPFLFSSLCYNISKHTMEQVPEVGQYIFDTNMMQLYAKLHQLAKFRLVQALDYIDGMHLSPLNDFYDYFTFKLGDELIELKKISPPVHEDTESEFYNVFTRIGQELIQPIFLKYLELELNQYRIQITPLMRQN